MSRIGNNPVAIPEGVELQVNGQDVSAKGKLGELSMRVNDEVSVALEESENGKIVRLAPKSGSRFSKQVWPTMRTLVNNIVIGVSEGYTKELEIRGVGYRANLQGKELVMQLGLSHDVKFPVPEGITIEVEKQTGLKITGIDKQKVGQTAAKIRGFRPPEPYKGKGIRYVGEYVLMKEGKKK